MRYIVTGGAGFIGSHFAEILIDQGNEVIAIDNLSTGNIDNVENLLQHQNFRLVQTDIRDISNWEDILQTGDTIIHLAATVGVDKVVENNLETFDNNYNSTKKILDEALRFGCKVFFASTSEIYGEPARSYSTELDPLHVPNSYCGRSGYALGKILSEFYCKNLHDQAGLKVVTGRLFNVTGIRQAGMYGMVAPTFINQALLDQPITIFGDGDQTRSFCNVNDIVHGILKLLACEKADGEIFNIGSAEIITIKELAEYIKLKTNSASPIIFKAFTDQRGAGKDIKHRKPSLAKIESFIDWKPAIPWQKTIDEMIVFQKDRISRGFRSF